MKVERQQLAQVLDGGRNAVDEVLLALEITAKTIGAQHLQGTEQDEKTQAVDEMAHRRHFGIVFQRIVVFLDELATQLMRIFGGCLPEERSQIVVYRTFASTLEIDETRIPVDANHDVASLEVAIEKTVCRFCQQVFGKEPEVGFQLHLVKVYLRSLQKAVFEIVQVEHHTVHIELRLRIALRPIHSSRSFYLNLRQLADDALQLFLLSLVVTTASLTTATNHIEERTGPQVFL